MILYYLKTFIRSSSGWNSFSPLAYWRALQTAFPQSDANVQANSMPDAPHHQSTDYNVARKHRSPHLQAWPKQPADASLRFVMTIRGNSPDKTGKLPEAPSPPSDLQRTTPYHIHRQRNCQSFLRFSQTLLPAQSSSTHLLQCSITFYETCQEEAPHG